MTSDLTIDELSDLKIRVMLRLLARVKSSGSPAVQRSMAQRIGYRTPGRLEPLLRLFETSKPG